MKRLFVGQRVLVVGTVWEGLGPKPFGKQGRIYAADVVGPITNKPFDWGVELDDGQIISADSHELEPILDKHDPCEADFKESLDRLLEREGLPA